MEDTRQNKRPGTELLSKCLSHQSPVQALHNRDVLEDLTVQVYEREQDVGDVVPVVYVLELHIFQEIHLASILPVVMDYLDSTL